ncbi:MAG TPA: hypothetical protein VMR86_14615 [Myxococcota bacterium]|nr:hypothetical protein [Myxococcota bacterium]
MMRKLTLALAAWLLSAAPAHASFIFNFGVTVTGGGLLAPNANYGCPVGSADCLASEDFALVSSTPASGVVLDGYQNGQLPEGGLIDILIANATFAPVSGVGPDVVFTNLRYQAFVPVLQFSLIQSGPGTGTVSGEIDGVPFTTDSAVYNLVCAGAGGPGTFSGQCGVAFGPQVFTAGGHNWLQTLNVTTGGFPEPGAAALGLLGGLAGLGGLFLRRRV